MPQEVFGFGDDDGVSFDGTVLRQTSDGKRSLVRFDYTCEEEWFPTQLLRRWLRAEVPIDPLCDRLSSVLSPEKMGAQKGLQQEARVASSMQ